MDFKIKSKKGQIAIFVILALILIVIIALLFLLKRSPEFILERSPEIFDENNPQAYIESCTAEAMDKAITIISAHGGDIKPRGSVLYKGKEYIFLCYNEDDFRPCIKQRPLLVEHIEDEITTFIRPKIAECFRVLKENFEGRYDIKMGNEMEINTRLQRKQVTVEIEREFRMSRKDKLRNFEDFKINVIHPIYDLSLIATEITNQEARYCHFDELGFMIIYPNYDVRKVKTADDYFIYTITERVTDQAFNFAVKTCTLPPAM